MLLALASLCRLLRAWLSHMQALGSRLSRVAVRGLTCAGPSCDSSPRALYLSARLLIRTDLTLSTLTDTVPFLLI